MPSYNASPLATVSFVTMGCAKNEVDSADMAERLARAGYLIGNDPEAADVIVVNTCSFIQAATEESIDAILEVAGYERVVAGNAHLIVSGCMPARYGSDLEAEIPEAGAFVPCSKEDDVVAVIDKVLGVQRQQGSPYTAASQAQAFHVAGASAYVKISDGCDRFCSYCSIPYIRGRYHSFVYEDIRASVQKRVSQGAKEIVLIAQDTGRWGNDFEPKKSLSWLMEALAGEFTQTWFRVMYIQPEGVTNELIDTVAAYPNICNYFDLPFQHVNADLLKSMNRSGSASEFNNLIARIKTAIPDATVRTTLIAGFPGETDDQFEELCDFVAEADLDYIGCFAYSREEGTRAFDLEGQIDEDEKASRAQQLRDLADSVCMPRIAQRVGREMDVLVCGREEDGQLFGRAMCQAPDVDGVVYLDEGAGEVGDVVKVLIEDTLLYEMEGTVV